MLREFPGGVWWLGLGTFTVRARVQSLVGKPRSRKLCVQGGKRKKERERKRRKCLELNDNENIMYLWKRRKKKHLLYSSSYFWMI